MKYLATIVAFVSTIAVSGSSAHADHTCRSLRQATSLYRDAVVDFEKHVRDLRYIEKYDRRLVDDLEDSTSDLRSAARDEDDLSRLVYAWQETQSLHARVEQAIFQRPCYPPNPGLAHCWQRVTFAYAEVAAHISRVLPGPYNAYPVEPYPTYGAPVTPPRFGQHPSTRSRDIVERVPHDVRRYRGGDARYRLDRDVVATPLPRPWDSGNVAVPAPRMPNGRRQAAAAIIGSLLNRVID